MAFNLRNRNFLKLLDFTPQEIKFLLKLSADLKEAKYAGTEQQRLKGKKAQFLGDLSKIHTYTYTPDAGKATAILGNTKDAYNQVWHLPTTKEKLTTLQWIEMIAKELNVPAKIQKVPTWLVHVLGLFVPIMKEFPEMNYQNEQDYIFDSSKFEKRFGIKATEPELGIKAMINDLRKKAK